MLTEFRLPLEQTPAPSNNKSSIDVKSNSVSHLKLPDINDKSKKGNNSKSQNKKRKLQPIKSSSPEKLIPLVAVNFRDRNVQHTVYHHEAKRIQNLRRDRSLNTKTPETGKKLPKSVSH